MAKLIQSPEYRQALEYLEQKDYTSAIVHFSAVLEDDYVDPGIHYYLAVCYANLQYHTEALEEIDSALQATLNGKKRVHLLNLKGYILSREGKHDRAAAAFEAALNLEKDNPVAYSGLGYSYYVKKDYAKALQIFKKGLTIAGDNPNLNNSYGYTLIESGTDVEEGIRRCEQALNGTPENGAVHDSLAWGYFKRGQIMKALVHIMRAMAQRKSFREIVEHYQWITAGIKQKVKQFTGQNTDEN